MQINKLDFLSSVLYTLQKTNRFHEIRIFPVTGMSFFEKR